MAQSSGQPCEFHVAGKSWSAPVTVGVTGLQNGNPPATSVSADGGFVVVGGPRAGTRLHCKAVLLIRRLDSDSDSSEFSKNPKPKIRESLALAPCTSKGLSPALQQTPAGTAKAAKFTGLGQQFDLKSLLEA